jgi:uncharacterized membrane protein YfcA
MSPTDVATAVGIGAVVGLLPGLFGVGGGFLMVPLLHLFAGVPLHLAVGSCAAQSLGTVTTGMLHRRGSGDLHYRLSLWMLPGTLAGLAAGVAFLNWTKGSTAFFVWHGRSLPRMEVMQLVCYLVIMLVLAAVVAVETYLARDEQEHLRLGYLEGLPLPPFITLYELDGRRASLPVITLLGAVVGFLNGGFGMGGALLLVPGLVFLVGLSTHRAVAATLVSSFLAGSFSAATHAASGNVDLRLVCWLLAGGTLGSQLGSIIAERLSGRRLRGYFSLVILGSTGFILYRLYELFLAAG